VSGADAELRRNKRNVIALLSFSVVAAIILARTFRLSVPNTVLSLIVGGGAPAGLYIAWGSLRQAIRPATTVDEDDKLVESNLGQLATTVQAQWDEEYKARTYNDPGPIHRDIKASWSAADAPLMVPWDELVELAHGRGWARSPEALNGLDEGDLRMILEKVPTGWLVVLGESGSGKTMLMLRTVRAIIEHRIEHHLSSDPVPLFVPMTSWDPKSESLRAWLERQLPIDYPGLSATVTLGGKRTTLISGLLDKQKIMPILDGLDEMPVKARVAAINQLNEAFTAPARPLRLVVTCRTADYREAVGTPEEGKTPSPVEAAAAIELHSLDVDKVSSYLGKRGRDPRWAKVDEQLRRPDDVLAKALNTPLYASLAWEIYHTGGPDDRGGPRNPDELCDRPDVNSVQNDLLDTFIPAVYAKEREARDKRAADEDEEPGQLPAERWLMFLANYLTKDPKEPKPLEWWNLRGLAPRRLVPGVVGAVCGVAAGVAAGTGAHVGVGIGIGFGTGMLIAIAIGLGAFEVRRRWDASHLSQKAYNKRYAKRRPGPGMAGGLIGAVIGGAAAGVAGKYHIGHQASLFSGVPEALGMALGAGASTTFFGGLTGVLIGGFVGGYLAGVGLGLPAGLVNGLGVAVAVGLAIEQVGRHKPSRTVPKWDPEIGIPGGCVIGLAIGLVVWREAGVTYGIVFGVLLAAVAAAPFGLRHMDEDLQYLPSPSHALARDVKAFWLTALSAGLAAGAAGFVGGSMTSIYEVHAKATVGKVISDGLGIGVASALVVGLTFGLYHAASPEFRIITWWLAIQRKAPWRFKHFLDKAYRLTVLRASGASYQFRHQELQKRLAARYRAEHGQPPIPADQPVDEVAAEDLRPAVPLPASAAMPEVSAAPIGRVLDGT
jgi:hypothetical protein